MEVLMVISVIGWKEDDFPNALDIELPHVAMTFEDSPHYPLDSDDADAEWQSIYPGRSFGFVRLGPEKRFFGLSVYHSLHCLNSLRAAILGRMHEPLVPAELIPEYPFNSSHHDAFARRELLPHADHCLGYLRQTILCNADLTLEPEYYEGAGDVPGSGATHVCRDWGTLYSFVEENAWEYEQWKQERKPEAGR